MSLGACTFVPPYLLERLAGAGDEALAAVCRAALSVDGEIRSARAEAGPAAGATGGFVVHSADQGAALPGRPVRTEADPSESGDVAVDEAWTGLAASLAMWSEVFGRDSYDDAGARVLATVHCRRNYVNAFWDGRQLVFGDGDGRVFERFTKPVDVLGHELAHAVTEHTAGLVYRDQPGALNESMSDVFGACLKQRILGQAAEEADWLVGAGLFLPGIQARGLRDMANPGTAYDDPVLGEDPQPAHLDDYVVTTDDNGGVHLNSGIANRAFVLAATALGGSSAEGAGRIWYAALRAAAPTTDFAGFAALTLDAAGGRSDPVRAAWEAVGVGIGSAVPGPVVPVAEAGVVEVRRSGGFAGRATVGGVDLAGGDARAAEVRALVERIDVRRVRSGGQVHPDGYTYEFTVRGVRFTVPEQDLDDDLRALADLLLSDEW